MKTSLTLALAIALVALSACEEPPLRLGGFCATGADCPPSQICRGGICTSSCTGSEECSTEEICRDTLCLPTCEAHTDCARTAGALRSCVAGVCDLAVAPGYAFAGDDVQVDEQSVVTLSAKKSHPHVPATTTYAWKLLGSNPKGVSVAIASERADGLPGEEVTFLSPSVVQDTTLYFRLTMQDQNRLEATDEMTVIVSNSINEPPAVGPLQAEPKNVVAGDIITVSIEADDPNPDDILAYSIKPQANPAVTLARLEGELVSVAQFMVKEAAKSTTVVFEVTVSDGREQQTRTAEVNVIVQAGIDCGLLDCDDGDPCTTDSCSNSKGCSNIHNSASCEDGNACTKGDACTDGACVPGPTTDCEDDDPCTAEVCKPSAGCVYTAAPGLCDDGSVCTEGDACAGSKCKPGTLMSCDDGNPCTTDICDPVVGCVSVDNALACDDGDKCTAFDACAEGSCVPGAPKTCDDGKVCTDDSCDPAVGCVAANNEAPCEDGNLCTASDTCVDGVCIPGGAPDCDDENQCTKDSCEPLDGCLHTPTTAPCDDGDACTTGDACGGGTCQPGDPTECDDGDQCTDDGCEPLSGCTAILGTSPCDDGDACTTGEACAEGACGGGEPTVCDDGNACTDDACDVEAGCTAAPNELPCDDGNACTEGDACVGGTCAPGPPVGCDDDNPCTDDVCDAAAGCYSLMNTDPCTDFDACTEGEACGGGVCGVGAPVVCNDGNQCTDDACDGLTGCAHTPNDLPCDDDDACTGIGQCEGVVCLPGIDVDCSDGNPCTDDPCHPVSGCSHALNEAPCEDGDPCTGPDACADGACATGGPTDCDDGTVCTTDHCDPTDGCVHGEVEGPCDDGDACTGPDACVGGACEGGVAISCDDGDPCTDDGCDIDGCIHVNNSAPCDDGDACTSGDACLQGACTPTGALSCNDSNLCTDDSCDPVNGCVHAPNGVGCDDGDPCTVSDVCAAGGCTPGAATTCDDDNPCTYDTCNFVLGCVNVKNQLPCDDGEPCTTGDYCHDGACLAGPPTVCTDGDPCTDDSCLAGQGCIATAKVCDDGSDCTTDSCVGGSCVFVPGACDDGEPCTDDSCAGALCAHSAVDCDDGNPCTDDSCVLSSGCASTNNALPCDDNDACTTSDVCIGGACVGPGMFLCDDGDPCTVDSCDPGAGCTAVAGPGPCDDGDACTAGDSCGGGACVGGPAVDCTDSDPCTDEGCDAATGCFTVANEAPCDDGDPCTTADFCVGGVCTGGPSPCDDDEPCTLETCTDEGGCQIAYAPFGTPCEDGGSLCSADGACTAFDSVTFAPPFPLQPDTRAHLTGVAALGPQVVASAGVVGGGAKAGLVFALEPQGQALLYQGPYPLRAMAADIAVGDGGAVVRFFGQSWGPDLTLGQALGSASPLRAVCSDPFGLGGDSDSAWLIGYDGFAIGDGGLATCSTFECLQEPLPSPPADVAEVFVASAVDPTSGAGSTLFRLALLDGGASAARILYAAGTEPFSEGPPSCDDAPGSACAGKGAFTDVAGDATSVWATTEDALLRFDGAGWSEEPAPLSGSLALRAIAVRGGHLLLAAEAPGCGEGPCAGDPAWRSLLLLHRAPDGAWSEPRLLGARTCATPEIAADCDAELALYAILDMVWTESGVVALVGGDPVVTPLGTTQQMLRLTATLGAP